MGLNSYPPALLFFLSRSGSEKIQFNHLLYNSGMNIYLLSHTLFQVPSPIFKPQRYFPAPLIMNLNHVKINFEIIVQPDRDEFEPEMIENIRKCTRVEDSRNEEKVYREQIKTNCTRSEVNTGVLACSNSRKRL